MRGNVTESETPEYDAWSSYTETVLIFAGEPKLVVDLRERVPQAAKRALEVMGLLAPFAVLTSFNPFGMNLNDEENVRRFTELEGELATLGLEYVVMNACSPDQSHCERSVAVCMERAAALDMAHRWEQLAIFWFDLEQFWIYGVIKKADPIALPA